MVRVVNHEARKRAILAATINHYIEYAQPVSSEEIARDFNLSSATIRNIFAELEKEGSLTHPYTSAGRIPTEQGWRYYVDFLLSETELLDEEKEMIVNEYKKEIVRLEDVLEKTSEVVSTITHYTSIVSLLEWQDRFFYNGLSFVLEEPEFRDSLRLKLLVRMLEERRNLLNIINREFSGKVKVYIGQELACPEMRDCAIAVSAYSVKTKPVGRLAVLGPVRMNYKHIIPTLEYVSEVLSNILNEI
ncbi:MAG: hypothetical protein NC908_01000 [Candidatus Omnitrophica bacterium]|nr:hypothetical protein [Candidatus Omnitrophota bacterium]